MPQARMPFQPAAPCIRPQHSPSRRRFRRRAGAPGRHAMTFDPRAQAYAPMRRPELFEGVPARRVGAFLIDMVIIAGSLLLAGALVLLLGLVTLGIGWGLFVLLAPPAW